MQNSLFIDSLVYILIFQREVFSNLVFCDCCSQDVRLSSRTIQRWIQSGKFEFLRETNSNQNNFEFEFSDSEEFQGEHVPLDDMEVDEILISNQVYTKKYNSCLYSKFLDVYLIHFIKFPKILYYFFKIISFKQFRSF